MTINLGTNLHNSITESLEQLFLLIKPSDLARVICNIEPCAVTGRVTSNEIAIALGEIEDIWPESARGDSDTTFQIDSLEPMHLLKVRAKAMAKVMPKLKAAAEACGMDSDRMTPSEMRQFARTIMTPIVKAKGKAKAKVIQSEKGEHNNIIQFPQSNL